jgi:hypothetical protein
MQKNVFLYLIATIYFGSFLELCAHVEFGVDNGSTLSYLVTEKDNYRDTVFETILL